MTVVRTMTLHRFDGRATIFLEGEIDLDNASAVGVAVQDCLSRGADRVDINLARLTFCDASGLNAFLSASRYMDAIGGRLRMYGSQPAVRHVFEVTNTAFLLNATGTTAPVGPVSLAPILPLPGRPAVSGDQ